MNEQKILTREEWELGKADLGLPDNEYELVEEQTQFGVRPLYYKGKQTGYLVGLWLGELLY